MSVEKVLFVNVGGSPQPIVVACRKANPERVIFVCSQSSRNQILGRGIPCEVLDKGVVTENLPNLVTQLELKSFEQARYLLVMEDVDSLQQVYAELDYTAGTTSVSAAMDMDAIDRGVL